VLIFDKFSAERWTNKVRKTLKKECASNTLYLYYHISKKLSWNSFWKL